MKLICFTYIIKRDCLNSFFFYRAYLISSELTHVVFLDVVRSLGVYIYRLVKIK